MILVVWLFAKIKVNLTGKKQEKRSINRCILIISGGGREWPYKNVKPRIIAEPLLKDDATKVGEQECLTDYKFFCFGGIPKIVYISKDKAENPTTDFFDMDYTHLPIRMRDPNSDVLPENRFVLMK